MNAWFFDVDEIEEIVARIPVETRMRTTAEAEAIVRGVYALNGHAPMKLQPVDWDCAPEGDVVWTRELNRHASFETLGFAYRYSHDELFARSFIDLSSSWIHQNEGRIGKLPWDTPLQVARRINSWMWSFFLFRDSPMWEESVRRGFLRTLGLLAEYLNQTIEYHSPGNHIILEAKTLAQCGEAFPEYSGAQRWRERGWRIIRREIAAQICEDGVHAERATMYHRIVAGELAELWLLSLRKGLSIAGQLEDLIRRMADFQKSIDLGRGNYPLFGDSRSEDSYYRFSAPVIVDDRRTGRISSLEQGMPDHTWWVISAKAPDESEAAPRPARRETDAFPHGGYYVSRSRSPFGEGVLVWDCGPFGYESNRKHAHADALSFVLAVDGEPVLIDPGVGGPRRFRRQGGGSGDLENSVERWAELRTTRAHNTVCVDEEDQALLGGRNEIWNPPAPEVVLWDSDPTYHVMWGRHDGYSRLRHPVLHDRLILASGEGYWLVLDRLSGRGLHTADVRYHLAPGSLCSADSSRDSYTVEKGKVRLNLSFFELAGEESSIVITHEDRLGELRGGSLERIKVLRARYTARVPFVLGTVLAVPASEMTLRAKAAADSTYEIDIGTDESFDRIVVRMDEDRRLGSRYVAPGLAKEAPVRILRQGPRNGPQLRAFGIGADGQSARLVGLPVASQP